MLLQRLSDIFLAEKSSPVLQNLEHLNGYMSSATPMANGVYSEIKRLLSDKDRKFYSFTPSALEIAQSMRVLDPDDFSDLIQIVTNTPRKIFVECGYQERMRLFENGGHSKYSRDEDLVDDPSYIASEIDIHGEGKASIKVWWTFAKGRLNEIKSTLTEMGHNKHDAKLLSKILGTDMAMYQINLDTAQANPISFSSFKERLQAGDPEYIRFLKSASKFVAEHNISEHGSLDMTMKAYQNYRSTELQTTELNENLMNAKALAYGGLSDDQLAQLSESHRRDLDGEAFAAISLLAALEVPEKTIEEQKLKITAQQQKKRLLKEEVQKRRDLPSVAIVSLKLDRDVQNALTQAYTERNLTVSSSGRSSPTRHLVRGHMVKRNGKLFYRKPHLRGSLDDRFVVTKVT